MSVKGEYLGGRRSGNEVVYARGLGLAPRGIAVIIVVIIFNIMLFKASAFGFFHLMVALKEDM